MCYSKITWNNFQVSSKVVILLYIKLLEQADVSITEKGKQLFHAFAKTNFVKVII